MNQLEGKTHNVIETLKALVRAEIYAQKDDDPDSMGSYHEEAAFSDALKALVEELKPVDRYEQGVRDGLSRAHSRPGDGDMGG